MEEFKTYFDRYTVAFDEFISRTELDLKTESAEYRKLFSEMENIKTQFPNVRSVLEDYKDTSLNNDEVKALLRVRDIRLQLERMETKAMFYAGGRELYLYLKKLNIIK